jgi:DNA-binding PadR family transcriptional regulator
VPQNVRMTSNTLLVLGALVGGTPRYVCDMESELDVDGHTIRSVLNRLAAAGWVTSELEDVSPSIRRARRYYRLRDEAVERVREELAARQARTL